MGVDIAGGCPHLDDDRTGCLDACLQAAADAGRPIDLHTDETLDPEVLGLRDFARLVSTSGFAFGATASHCVSLGMQDEYTQHAVAAEVAEAGIAVVTLPQTNLFLQGHAHRSAMPRGLTAIRPLLDAGVIVAGGADNVQDPFNTMGRADPLETAALLVMVGHLLPHEAYEAVSTSARAAMGLEPVSIAAGFTRRAARSAGEHLAGSDRDGPPRSARLPPWPAGRPDVFDDDVLRPRGRHRAFT